MIEKKEKLSVNPYILNSIYLVILPVMMLAFVDRIFFDEYIKNNSPMTLDFILWFNIAFNFPHIICSFLIMCEKNYIIHFRQKLLALFVASLCFVSILVSFRSSFLQETITLVALLWTVKHVVGQQFSMTKIFLRVKEDWVFKAWRIYGILIASLVFLGIYSKIYTYYFGYLYPVFEIFNKYSFFCVLPVFILSAVLLDRSIRARNKSGTYMIIGNMLMVASSVILYSHEYYCLSALGPRIIHDLSALYFYGIHSFNKRKSRTMPKNFWGIMNHFQPLPLFISSSFLSVSILWLCFRYGDLNIYHALSAIHFYTESFFWKNDSPAREHLVF